MTAIERAEVLLAAATEGPWPYSCLTLEKIRRWMRRNGAQRPESDTRLAALSPTMLRGYIGAVKALDVAHDFCCDFEDDHPCTTDNCQVQKAIADFERLFPEDSHSCTPGTYPDCCYPETPASAD